MGMGQPYGIVLIGEDLFAPNCFAVEHTHINRLNIFGPVHIHVYILLRYHNLSPFGNPFPDHEFGILKGTPQFVVFSDKQQILFQAEDSQHPEIVSHRNPSSPRSILVRVLREIPARSTTCSEDNSRRKRVSFIFSPKAVSVFRWLGNNARFMQ